MSPTPHPENHSLVAGRAVAWLASCAVVALGACGPHAGRAFDCGIHSSASKTDPRCDDGNYRRPKSEAQIAREEADLKRDFARECPGVASERCARLALATSPRENHGFVVWSCDRGVAYACAFLADAESDPVRKYALATRACHLDSAVSCATAADLAPTANERVDALARACRLDQMQACRVGAELLWNGQQMPANPALARTFALAGCRMSDEVSCIVLGQIDSGAEPKPAVKP